MVGKKNLPILLAGYGVVLLFLLSLVSPALAGPYTGTPNPIMPEPGAGIPGPTQVTGKEYSDEVDKNASGGGAPDAMQTIAWDGTGGVADGFDYDGLNRERGPQVDAMAHPTDLMFNHVIANNAALLFSMRTPNGTDTRAPIYSEHIKGGISPWATPSQVDQHGVTNLDGLEVWGPDHPGDNALMFSLQGDPNGIAVYSFMGGSPATPYLRTSEIADAMDLRENLIDVDAMMLFDIAGNGVWEQGDFILFSLWANPFGNIVGDEVWVWENGVGINFLNHGGHLWDSGWLGMEIDALEAVATPLPSAILLFWCGLLGFLGIKRRKQ